MNDILTFFFVTSITTDIANSELNNTLIFPNPTKDIITVSHDVSVTKIELMDMNGKVLLEKSDSQTLDLIGLSSGIYFVKIYNSVGCLIKKIIKE